MADGFLGRWAKRKEAVRQGKEVPPEPVAEVAARGPGQEPSVTPAQLPAEGEAGTAPVVPPAPTLDDVQALTPESDFTRFVRPDVDPQVKNAAMKKLFADPHFNVMDGLDTYIDDYGKPDPIPPEMLKHLLSSPFFRVFEKKDDEEEAAGANAPTEREVADDPAPESVAQSSTRTEQALPPAEDHADPDLRLQQDDAPGPAGPGAGSR